MKPVSPNIWNSEDFHSLSPNGKVVWFHLITGSHANQGVPGLFRGTRESLRIETRMSAKAHTAAFNEVARRGMMERDEALGVIWLPQAVRWNLPASHSEIRAWAEGLNHLPYCKVVDRARTKVVMDLYKFRSLGFSSVAWAVWEEVFGDRLSPVTLDEALRTMPGYVAGTSQETSRPGLVSPDVSPGSGSLSACKNARAPAGGHAVPVNPLALDLNPDLGLESDAGARDSSPTRNWPDMSDDVADVIQMWLDDVCATMPVKPTVAQAHVDRVQGLLSAGIPKDTLISALRGASDDPYVQGKKPGSPRGGRRDLLWLFRTLDAILVFATDGAAVAPKRQRTWITPADLAAKADETGPIAPQNQEGMRKLAAILGNPPGLAPGVPITGLGPVVATGVATTSGNDVLGASPLKGEPISTPGQTPIPSEALIVQLVDELQRLQEEDRETAFEIFEQTYGIPFPREKLGIPTWHNSVPPGVPSEPSRAPQEARRETVGDDE
jgi:hypothetical protein